MDSLLLDYKDFLSKQSYYTLYFPRLTLPAFEEAVEDYLELCNLNGKEPEKMYKGSFNIRIRPELHKQAAQRALIEGKSLNQYVEEAIEQYSVNGRSHPKKSDS